MSPEILFYTNNLRADYIVAEFTLKFDTGLGWRHAVSAALNLMPDGVTVKTRWPLTHRGGRFSNCPDGMSNAPVADLWVKERFMEFLEARGGLGSQLLPPAALAALTREVRDPASRAGAVEARDGWTEDRARGGRLHSRDRRWEDEEEGVGFYQRSRR